MTTAIYPLRLMSMSTEECDVKVRIWLRPLRKRSK
jgi:hypothetical protein